jgi:transposase-like protein
MIHYRNDSHSYEELLDYLRRELRAPSDLVIGSDGAPAIKSAVAAVFPDSIHLFCVRHVRNNIERHLMKIQLPRDERRELLEYMFDCPESLVQSETEAEFNQRLDGLREVWHGIIDRSGARFNDTSDFFTWFDRYQLETFRHHLIASVRIQAGYLDRYDSPRLFYNNDIEALNHVLKHDANWEIQSLSRIIDIIENQISMQKNESIRALYDAGEFEIVAPYTR